MIDLPDLSARMLMHGFDGWIQYKFCLEFLRIQDQDFVLELMKSSRRFLVLNHISRAVSFASRMMFSDDAFVSVFL
jgi:hypothetical protein